MTFKDRYNQCESWHEKVLVMGLYHLAQQNRYNEWTIRDTADYFDVSTGLVSENLRLYKEIDNNIKLIKLTREQALRSIR